MINRDLETLRVMDVQKAARKLYDDHREVAHVALVHPTDYEPIHKASHGGACPKHYVSVCFYTGMTYRELHLRRCERVPQGALFVGTEEQAKWIEEEMK